MPRISTKLLTLRSHYAHLHNTLAQRVRTLHTSPVYKVELMGVGKIEPARNLGADLCNFDERYEDLNLQLHGID